MIARTSIHLYDYTINFNDYILNIVVTYIVDDMFSDRHASLPATNHLEEAT